MPLARAVRRPKLGAMNTPRGLLLILSSVWLVACSRQETVREIDWAKAALARNPDFEIVATDEQAGVFTVRETSSGTMKTLHLKDLIAAPLPARAETTVPPGPAPGPSSALPEAVPTPAELDPTQLADGQTTLPADAADPVGAALAEGPGYRISRGTADPTPTGDATLEGPGYRIERTPAGASGSARTSVASPTQTPATGERRSDPIICQGNRLMHIDGETIEFTGDAVIAEKGCDLYISNARIRAGGVGIIARQQARVHIRNSTIGGSRGSYEASEGGEIYVAQSTFEGVGRRFDGGSMTDLGGNVYSSR